jgi:hypothetical protein
MIRFSRDLVPLIFFGFVIGLWGILVATDLSLSSVLWFAGFLASIVFCVARCQDGDYGYFQGYTSLARKYGGGLINITACFLFPVFLFVHFLCVMMCIVGLLAGKSFTQKWWAKITERDRIATTA